MGLTADGEKARGTPEGNEGRHPESEECICHRRQRRRVSDQEGTLLVGGHFHRGHPRGRLQAGKQDSQAETV